MIGGMDEQKLSRDLEKQFTALALHRIDNVREPIVATVAFLAKAAKGMPTEQAYSIETTS